VSDQGDGIFREIDEEVRRDQLLALWKRYGRVLVAGLLVIVLTVLGYQLWRNQIEESLERQSALYQEAVEAAAEAGPAETAEIFGELAGRLEGGYARLAKLRLAGAHAQAGELAAAADLYREVAEAVEDARLSAYARYMAGAALLEAEGPDAAIAMLAPLEDPSQPLHYSALELLGVAYLEAGDREAAIAQFAAIAEDPSVPPALKGRAEDMLAMLRPAEAEEAPESDEADMPDAPAPPGEAEGPDAPEGGQDGPDGTDPLASGDGGGPQP